MSSKLRKLITMSPREIAFRVGYALAMKRERRQFRKGQFHWNEDEWRRRLGLSDSSQSESLAEACLEHMRQREEPAILFDSVCLEQSTKLYHDRFPDRIAPVSAAAEKICRGEISFLGIDVTLSDPIDWYLDPKCGYQWESCFHGDVEFAFCQEGGGDVKYVWEPSRQEYLIDCAKAYRLTGEQRYADHVYKTAGSWISGNPYLDGINWASTLEVGMRSLVWMWCYQYCRPHEGLSPEAHLQWIQSSYQHGSFLYRHLSFYFSPNNHLIGEAAALYLLGCFFPEFDEATQWRGRGWSVVVEHSADQYYEDGGSAEQATFYHHYTLGFLMLAILTRQRRGESVPQAMLDRVEKALDFSMWMTRGDGTIPRIGDVDNARSIRFEEPPLWDFRNLLSLGAVMFGRGDMKTVAGHMSEDVLWLLGPSGIETYEQLEASVPSETSKLFPNSGYLIMRSGWDEKANHLAFDGGPLAEWLHTNDVPSSAHGHSDLLAFTLSAFGRPLFVDGGCYTYDEDPAWHRYFREASAHNTALINGASHARYHQSNAWSNVATPESFQLESTSEFLSVSCAHTGFYGVEPAVRHQRTIYWNRDQDYLIEDCLEGVGQHDIEVFFHFAPGAASKVEDAQGVVVQTDEGIHAALQLQQNAGLQVEVIEGGEGPDGGWIGTSYGSRQRAPVVRFFGRMSLPRTLSFSIRCSQEPLASSETEQSTWLPKIKQEA